MKNKVVRLVAFCMASLLLVFLPGLFNLGVEVYLDLSMKSTGKLPTVNTYRNLERLLKNNRNSYNFCYHPSLPSSLNVFSFPTSDVMIGSINSLDIASSFLEAGAVANSSTNQSSTNYSSTNIQVAGIDEADILKNDGKYIYAITQNKLVIVEAFPVDMMRQVYSMEIENGYRAIDLYVLDNKLFLVTDNNNSRYINSTKSIETKFLVMDITNRSNPSIIKTFEITGSYSSSRMVDEKIYVFANKGINKLGDQYVLPKYRESEVAIFREVSLKDIQYIPADEYGAFSQIISFDLSMPLNSPKMVTYLGSSTTNVYMSYDNLYMAQSRYDKTNIYKFDLDNEYPRFVAKGSVPGSIINQFAMDEYDGNFRIATTKNNVNAVYVLSESMHRLGVIDNIAKGEQIKSVRFEGERGYIVTFRNTDPLFVLELKNPRAPKILGELKITGYSTYLHPYDENHVIGFGYDGNSWGTNGKLKLALFDITDVTNPKEMFKEVINASTSELFTNHKSLLFSKDKNLIAFSVGNYRYLGNSNKVGKVYTINLEEGFSLRGEIRHNSDLNRMIYMEDILYGVSETSVSAHNINSIEEIKRVDFI